VLAHQFAKGMPVVVYQDAGNELRVAMIHSMAFKLGRVFAAAQRFRDSSMTICVPGPSAIRACPGCSSRGARTTN
jgi:hypothetical protein